MEYFEVPEARPGLDGLCSDNDCPCGYPGATIPRGKGYMYVSGTVVDFRKDARTVAQAEAKIAKMRQDMNSFTMFGQDVVTSTLMCEQGAKKRGLDLDIAAADAKYWWETGLAPLRATPKAGNTEAKKEKERMAAPAKAAPAAQPAPAVAAAPAAATPAASPAATPAASPAKKWWEFWK
jgi:ribosomal protein L24E